MEAIPDVVTIMSVEGLIIAGLIIILVKEGWIINHFYQRLLKDQSDYFQSVIEEMRRENDKTAETAPDDAQMTTDRGYYVNIDAAGGEER